jgi:hypothetical protein
MMNRRCDRCGNRVRTRSRRCRHCNWEAPASPRRVVARRVAAALAGLTIALAGLFLVARNAIEPDTIADWYAEFAMQHLPRHFSDVAPAESASGAYYFCVRRVVRDHLERESVATFPMLTAENTTPIGEGAYRVHAHVIEETATGERLRRDFTCTAEYERNRWVLHELELGTHARLDRANDHVARQGG